jgi:hypothetical protein
MSELQAFVHKLSLAFSNIQPRKTYGLDSFAIRDNVFIMITEDQKIALKVEDFIIREKILKIEGVEKWIYKNKEMENWYLLPPAFNKKKNKLAPILEMIHPTVQAPRKTPNTKPRKIKKSKQQLITTNAHSKNKDQAKPNALTKILQKLKLSK